MKNIDQKFSVLLPQGPDDLLLLVVNCLSRKKQVDIYVMSNNPNSVVIKSNKIKNFSFYPKIKSYKEWVLHVNNELNKFDIDVVMPYDEYGIYAAIKLIDQIKQKEKLVFLPSSESFVLSNNKGALAKYMAEHNISAPETVLYKKNQVCEKPPVDFPIILKPVEGNGGRGIYKFENEASLKTFFSFKKVEEPYLIQKYIVGYDIDCSVLCKDGKILAYTIQKAFLAGRNEFDPNEGVVFLNRKDILDEVKRLMKLLNWSGVAHIDMRYDLNEGSYKVVEINPRFWGTMEASEIAGVNFPYLYCMACLNQEFEQPKFKETKFLNLIGLSKTIKANKWFVFRLKFIFCNTPLKYYLNDPKPMFAIIFNKLRSMWSRKI